MQIISKTPIEQEPTIGRLRVVPHIDHKPRPTTIAEHRRIRSPATTSRTFGGATRAAAASRRSFDRDGASAAATIAKACHQATRD